MVFSNGRVRIQLCSFYTIRATAEAEFILYILTLSPFPVCVFYYNNNCAVDYLDTHFFEMFTFEIGQNV